MTAPDGDAAKHEHRARRRVVLVVVALLVVLLAGLARWASRPQQVAGLVLSQASRALGLRITAKGATEYTLRGMPRLVLRDVTAQREGDATPVLHADRILLSLPWSTLKSRGRDLVVHRVEVERPRIDIAALQRWLATRPPSSSRATPTLTDGFVVIDGRVIGEGWTIEALSADVPRLADGQPVRARLRGRVDAGETRMPFDVAATLARPAADAGLGVAGRVEVRRPDWRMPLDLVLRARPDLDDGLALDALAMRASARYVSASSALAFRFGVAGRAAYAKGLHLAPFGLALRQGREIPDLTAGGRLDWTAALGLHLDGEIARWPSGWPELPAPIGRPKGPLPTTLDYAGPTDLSGVTSLALRSGATRFDGRFRLPRILSWIDASARGTPLPPLDGRVWTPRLEIPGATLEGVEVESRDDD
ncbi:AsmA family protein [Lysobacter xanthus]